MAELFPQNTLGDLIEPLAYARDEGNHLRVPVNVAENKEKGILVDVPPEAKTGRRVSAAGPLRHQRHFQHSDFSLDP